MCPQAEKLNGRACMVGYGLALIVDKLTGATLSEMQGSFLGLLSLHIVVFGVLLFPTLDRVQVQSSSYRVHLLSRPRDYGKSGKCGLVLRLDALPMCMCCTKRHECVCFLQPLADFAAFIMSMVQSPAHSCASALQGFSLQQQTESTSEVRRHARCASLPAQLAWKFTV